VLRAAEGTLFIPAPEPLIEGLLDFLRTMWPAPAEQAESS